MLPTLAETGQDVAADTISPEGALVAETYLQEGCDVARTSQALSMPPHEISRMIQEKAVDNYITQVISDSSLRSMDKISDAMDELIQKKLNELEELEMTSSKDIADLLNMHHKMQVDKARILADKQKKVEKINARQTNVSISNFDSGNYGRLMHALIEGEGN